MPGKKIPLKEVRNNKLKNAIVFLIFLSYSHKDTP